MLVIDGGAVIVLMLVLAASFFLWRATSRRRSIAKAAQADDLARLLARLQEFAAQRRDTNPGLDYIASEIELFHERKKL